jgi:hypothetical protein
VAGADPTRSAEIAGRELPGVEGIDWALPQNRFD